MRASRGALLGMLVVSGLVAVLLLPVRASAAGPDAGSGRASYGTSATPGTARLRPARPAGASGALSSVLETSGQLGYVAAGVAMRNLGEGTITITGVPAGATVQSATLMWDILADTPADNFRLGTFDGTPINGRIWDLGASPCWPEASGNYSYEADVTSLVPGNGSYQLTDFATGQADGADPWLVSSVPPLLEGASLVVIYQSATAPQTDIQIDMGATELTENTISASLSGFTAGTSHAATTTFIVGDGQEEGNLADFDGTSLPGVTFAGDDPQTVARYSMGNLWDTVTTDVSSLVSQGDTAATLSVSAGRDCVVWVGQVLAVQEAPAVGVAAVRFGPASASAPGTAGLPVIKDDKPAPGLDHKTGPASCPDGLANPRAYDYLTCTTPPSGKASKNWPVIEVAKHQLTIDKAVFFADGALTSPTLTATAVIDGVTLTLPATTLTSAPVHGAYQLSASRLSFTGTLPSVPGVDNLAITWTITSGGNPLPAGTSTHRLYLTAAPYLAPQSGEALPPYVTLLDVATRAAAGRTTPKAVFQAIFAKLVTLKVAHPILHPASGTITSGPAIKYYDNGYPLIGDFWTKPLSLCPPADQALSQNSGHCGSWAEFLTNMLSYQGIQNGYVSLGDQRDFYPGPAPRSGDKPDDYVYMLVGPSLWQFTGDAPGIYSFVDPITVRGTDLIVSPGQVRYHPSRKPIAQGLVMTPPPLFGTGDHAIVHTPWGYVDPSYGLPRSGRPYQTLGAYEKAALAGFAVIYAQARDGRFAPLPRYDAETIISVCGGTNCEFRAVPYGKSGAPG